MLRMVMLWAALSADAQPAGEGFPAVIIARQATDVGAPRAGVLARVTVTLGQQVEAGSVLAELETEALELELATAQVALREAEGERSKAQVFLAKANDLCERIAAQPEAFAASEHKDAEFNLRLARQELSIAEIRIERQRLEIQRLRELMERSQQVAPFSGTVSMVYQQAGAIVSHASPLVRLITPDDLLVRFAIPASERRALAPGEPVRFWASQDDGQAFAAIVERISPEVDPVLQMIVVEARLLPSAGSRSAPRPGLGGHVLLTPRGDFRAQAGPRAEPAAPTPLVPEAEPQPAARSDRKP